MFDFMRDRGSTAEERRLEALGAYLDNALAADERERFESRLAHDAELRAELERMRALKMQMRAMPRRRVPRSFALDPALYGRPKPQPMMQLYPFLRGATALTAFFLMFTLALGAFRGQFTGGGAAEMAAPQAAMIAEETAMDAAPAPEAAPADLPAEASEAPGVDQRTRPTVEASPKAEGLGAGASTLGVEGTLTPEELAGDAAQFSTEATDRETAEMPEQVEPAIDQVSGRSIGSLLFPAQIALAAALLLLLVLLLIVRSRLR